MPLTNTDECTDNEVIKYLLAVILPPLGVLAEVGATKQFWINVVLTMLGFFPGVVHAIYVISSR